MPETIPAEDLAPRDVLANGTEILGRPETRSRMTHVVTERGVLSWPKGTRLVSVTRWWERINNEKEATQ